jgi:hypothetical protein
MGVTLFQTRSENPSRAEYALVLAVIAAVVVLALALVSPGARELALRVLP